MKKRLLVITCMLYALLAVYAGGENFHRFHLDHRDGLLSNYVRSIGQDGRGFVWVATDNGLNRYDGTSFTCYTKENSGLTSNELNCILADPVDKDVVWFSTRHKGICRYDYRTGQITQPVALLRELHSPDIPFMSTAHDGKMWITHYHFPPDCLDPATGEVEPLFDRRRDDFPCPVWCAVEDRGGSCLYVGHVNSGMSRVNLDDRSFKNYRHDPGDCRSIGGNTVFHIMIDRDGMVWAGTDKGVSVYDPVTERFINL